jgi:hypothetical protein
MPRPTILNRPITLRARRISPTRPARLVGPSRLLRRDEVRNPHTNGPRDRSFEMRGACRNHRCHHAKRCFKPFPATETVGSSDRVEYRRYCHDDDGVIQPDIPSSVYFPDIPCGSLAALIRTAYTSWLIGAKEESKDPESLANSSAMPVTEEAEGSSLNFKMVASPGIATCGGLAAAQLGRRSRRRPDLIGAAQHPGIEQRAIIASCRLILRFWRFVG